MNFKHFKGLCCNIVAFRGKTANAVAVVIIKDRCGGGGGGGIFSKIQNNIHKTAYSLAGVWFKKVT